MAAKGISFVEAKKVAAREMGRKIQEPSFERMRYGGHAVDILLFTCQYVNDDITTIERRMSVFVDGKSVSGVIL